MSNVEFQGVKPNPYSSSNIKETQRLIGQYEEVNKQIKDVLRPGQAEASVTIKSSCNVIRILNISDFHFGSDATSYEEIQKTLAELERDDTYCVFDGDILEGFKQEYSKTSTNSHFNFGEQITALRSMIKTLVLKGKVLAVVSGYNGHDDWPSGKESLDIPAALFDDLRIPYKKRPPVIYNGGVLNVHVDEDSPGVRIRLFHKTVGSGSTINPVKPLRKVIIDEKIDRDQKTPMIVFGGHNHSRAGASSERTRLPNGKEVQLVYLQNGTVKGLDPNNPDPLVTEKGCAKPQPSGAAVILRKKPNGEVQVVPTYGNERSRILLEAEKVLNKAESLHVTEELRQELEYRNGQTGFQLQENESIIAERTGGRKIDSKLYTQLVWRYNIGELGLPVCIYPFAHYDSDSSHSDKNFVTELIDDINNSESTGLLILKGMLSKSVPGRTDRVTCLDNFAQELGEVPASKRVGIMLDSVLRSDKWNKEIKHKTRDLSDLDDDYENEDNHAYNYERPVVTGDYLYYDSDLSGTPLFEGNGYVVFDVGHHRYNFLCIDGTGNFGSRMDGFLGLMQMDRESQVLNEVVTGGNSIIPGALTLPDKIYISNGWNCPAIVGRNSHDSIVRVPKGGQGVIMLPTTNEKGLIFGCGSLRETRDTFTGLTLYQGLLAEGQWKKFIRRSQ